MSNLGINPSNDGKCIRLSIPLKLRRKEEKNFANWFARWEKKRKIAVENLRRDANDALKKRKKQGN